MLISFLVSSVVLAEERKSEWRHKEFDFKQLKTVLVELTVDGSVNLDSGDQQRLNELYQDEFAGKSKNRTRLVTVSQLEDTSGKTSGENLKDLRLSNPERYRELMDQFTPIYADAVLKVKVKALGYTKVWVPDRTERYTEYQEVLVNTEYRDSKGRVVGYKTDKVQVPVEKTRLIPAHYAYTAHAGAELSLLSKQGQSVWMLVDMREAPGTKVPIEMTQRIFNRAVDKFFELGE
jgi:hypothetical protein